MRIRRAGLEDVDAIIELGLAFQASTPYVWMGATPESIRELCRWFFEDIKDAGVCLVAVDRNDRPYAMLAGAESSNLFNGERFADEIIWFVHPSHRGAERAGPYLLRSFEDWARARGLHKIKMVAPHGSTVGNFYTKVGYRHVEAVYWKGL